MEAQLFSKLDSVFGELLTYIKKKDIEKNKKIEKLEKKIETLEKKFESSKKKEKNIKTQEKSNLNTFKFYRNHLQKKLGGAPTKNFYGITDLSDEHTVIEIKHWTDYEKALGNAIAYSQNTNKRCYAFFFGEASDELRRDVTELFNERDISIFQLIKNDTDVDIIKILDTREDFVRNTPGDWIPGRLRYSKDDKVSLMSLTRQFYGRHNITLVERHNFNEHVNLYISNIFDHNDVNRIGDVWYNLVYYDIDDPFMKWLDDNVVYKKDNILTISDICKRAGLGSNLAPRTLGIHRPIVENFIKIAFQNIKTGYKNTTYNGIHYKGWLHLGLKDTENEEK
jgi:hypothetical protein